VAGATFNIVLAVLVMTVSVRIWGKDEPVRATTPPEIADLRAGSSAAAAGLKIGDRVVSIAGRDARDPETQPDEILLSPDKVKAVEIERDGQRLTVEVNTDHDPVYHLGEPGWRLINPAAGPPVIDQLTKGRPADKAGLKVGDRVAAVNGREIGGEKEVRAIIERSAGRELSFTVLRSGQTMDLPVVPLDEGGVGKIGVGFAEGGARAPRRGPRGGVRGIRRVELADHAERLPDARQGHHDADLAARVLGADRDRARLARGRPRERDVPDLPGAHLAPARDHQPAPRARARRRPHPDPRARGFLRRELSDRVKERVMQAGFVFLLAFFGIVIFFDILKARH
jgi:regulator of sigma E protease